jgi:hypothetical protein
MHHEIGWALKTQVRAIRHERERAVVVELRPVHGEVFPPFDPGSHAMRWNSQPLDRHFHRR